MFQYNPSIMEPSQEELRRFEEIGDHLQELREEFALLHRMIRLGRIGPWEETDSETLYVSPEWSSLFDEKFSVETRENYLAKIDDPKERKRVEEARNQLSQEEPGTIWEDVFSLQGKRIRSTAYVGTEHVVYGVDAILS